MDGDQGLPFFCHSQTPRMPTYQKLAVTNFTSEAIYEQLIRLQIPSLQAHANVYNTGRGEVPNF